LANGVTVLRDDVRPRARCGHERRLILVLIGRRP